MKDIQKIRLLAGPALAVILGLILLVNPDSASALIGTVLGWIAVLIALAEAFSGGKGAPVKGILFGCLGVLFLTNPLLVARFLGRALGLSLFVWSMGGIRRNRGKKLTPGLLFSCALLVVGFVLFVTPMTTSRLVLAGVGILIILVGVTEALERLRENKQLEEPEDPNIIDVEKI